MPGDDHGVGPERETRALECERLTQEPLDAVALDRAAHLA
jgi:hypothetical protein